MAGHRVEDLGADRSRLTLSLDMRGLITPIIGLFSRGLVTRYMSTEAQGMKLAAESAET